MANKGSEDVRAPRFVIGRDIHLAGRARARKYMRDILGETRVDESAAGAIAARIDRGESLGGGEIVPANVVVLVKKSIGRLERDRRPIAPPIIEAQTRRQSRARRRRGAVHAHVVDISGATQRLVLIIE